MKFCGDYGNEVEEQLYQYGFVCYYFSKTYGD